MIALISCAAVVCLTLPPPKLFDKINLMSYQLSFEEVVLPLEAQLNSLKKNLSSDSPLVSDLNTLDKQINRILEKIYKNLEPWQYVLVARHPDRPTGVDYIRNLITDFAPVSGDRSFGEDSALICGLGKFDGMPVAVVGHNKGFDIDERIKNNFGMAHPEGYRKVARLMDLASRFGFPIITFIDTKGAAANKGSEERGQGYALADCIRANFRLKVPLISVIVGEGGSGGAIALASGHSIMMLKYSIFAVASPDACAAILWKDRAFSSTAATALKITSTDLIKLGVVDKEIEEPIGGAHRFPEQTFENARKAIKQELLRLKNLSLEQLIMLQQEKFRKF